MVTTIVSGTLGEGERRVLDPKLPVPPLHHNLPTAKSIFHLPTRSKFLSTIITDPDDAPIHDIDPGVFNVELLNQRLYLNIPKGLRGGHIATGHNWAGGKVRVGTYEGTQAAITHVYQRLEGAYGSYLDARGIESTLPRYVPLEKQRQNYVWSQYPRNSDDTLAFPPHLNIIPDDDQVHIWEIFDNLGLAEAKIIIQKIMPDSFLGKTKEWLLKKAREAADGTPEQGVTIQDVVDYNEHHRKSGTDILKGENIGLLSDWFGDRRFAEQSFSGTNPLTITQAPEALVQEFIEAAGNNGDNDWAEILTTIDRKSLLVQDYSYFRKAIGIESTENMQNQEPGADMCWTVAPVALYQLHDDGKLHPIAITIDYKGSMANSVTLFNKRKDPSAPTDGEKEDWPWRYAKTAVLSADWIRHELTIHLNDAHFIEEAIIVATNRQIPMDHVVYKLLSPHWYKTLSLNAAARSTLVPQVIQDIVGFTPGQSASFLQNAYKDFNFVDNYVPQQLEGRGFPSDPKILRTDARYKNYPYAKDMSVMWFTIREYVKEMLQVEYTEDEEIANEMIKADKHISNWCSEVKNGALIQTFPQITTLDQLVDAITMCIHLAAPYHTAVNYLQNYYMAFVAAKPSSLCAQPPVSLDLLKSYTETDLIQALPINRQRQWLLASHISWLLSFKVASERSLLNFALSQYSVYKSKEDEKGIKIRDATHKFYKALTALQLYFYDVSTEMDEGAVPYMVMDPGNTAVSILI